VGPTIPSRPQNEEKKTVCTGCLGPRLTRVQKEAGTSNSLGRNIAPIILLVKTCRIDIHQMLQPWSQTRRRHRRPHRARESGLISTPTTFPTPCRFLKYHEETVLWSSPAAHPRFVASRRDCGAVQHFVLDVSGAIRRRRLHHDPRGVRFIAKPRAR
jgi:hypothetical protein